MLIGDYGTPPNPYANGLLNPWADPRSPGNGFLALAAAINPRNRFVAGMQNYGQQVAAGQDAEMKRRYMGMQMQEAEEKMLAARQKREALKNLPDPGFLLGQSALLGGGGPTNANAANIPAVPPHLQQLHQFAKSGLIEPEHYIKAITPQAEEWSPTPQVMRDADGKLVNVLISKTGKTKVVPFGVKPDIELKDTGGEIVPVDKSNLPADFRLPKTGNPFNDLVLRGQNGQMVPNAPLVNVKSQIAHAGKTDVHVNSGQKGLENELKIRGEFKSEPIYKAHQEVQSAYQQISAALKQASPAGDLAGATKIMKILDPGSVVRESELGMAMAASGALDRLQHYATNIMNGTKLTPTQRRDFQTLADSLYQESAKQYNAKRNEYAGFANDYQLNANRIVGPAITSPKLPQGGGATPMPTGGKVRFLGFEGQ